MKRAKSKDPPRRLNLRAWERNTRLPGPDDPPAEEEKKREKDCDLLQLVFRRRQAGSSCSGGSCPEEPAA